MDFPRATHVKKNFFQVILTFLTSATTLQHGEANSAEADLRQNWSPGVLPSCCSSLSLVFCMWFLPFCPNAAVFLYLFFFLLLFLCICHGPYHHYVYSTGTSALLLQLPVTICWPVGCFAQASFNFNFSSSLNKTRPSKISIPGNETDFPF